MEEFKKLNRKRFLYGATGFLSLLGLIGVFTEARSFLGFFAFAVDFQYFFISSDEMMEYNMNRSASRAFYFGMASVAFITAFLFFVWGRSSSEALLEGIAGGWAVSVVVYALSSAYYGFRESWGLRHDDKEQD